ncbi:hypothetical protein Q8A67_010746 [Cirrhinus molitorella]|uniref:Ig-like domain-containing protein n=1 Tax=Cirrhinus molitorella TaxID=172907 RepID=A0AA88TQM2_9TELE|nr:hypothetical protein Q8A67_010746 [Cirrhinus molitorella]
MHIFFLIIAFFNTIFGAEEHAYQQFIGCAFNNKGQVSRFWRYGYDGRDIMHVDLAKEAVVATSEPGQLLAEERQSKEYIKRKEARLVKVCSAVKTVFLKSNNSLSRAAKPAVYMSSGGKKDQEYLKCVVHGFYPNVIKVRWTQKGRPVYFGVSTTGILPHKDGTFQMTSYLSLSNVSAHDVTCEIEHLSIDGKLKMAYEEKSSFLSQITEHAPVLSTNSRASHCSFTTAENAAIGSASKLGGTSGFCKILAAIFTKNVAGAMSVEDPEKAFEHKHNILRLQARTRASVKPPGT